MNREELIGTIQQEAKESKTIADLAEDSFIPQGVEIPQPELVFAMGGIPMFTKKSISTLKGQAKAGKTTVTAWIVSNVLRSDIKVLWIDTEQGLYYGSRTQFWVLSIAGMAECPNLIFHDLKIYNPKQRIEIIEYLLDRESPDLVIVDGIRDLVFDINSPEEATMISGDLMRWADTKDCHIMNIIHENKASSTARGHLGTELINKSELVMKVSRNEEKQTVCEPEFTRGEPFEMFAFERDSYGMPQLVSVQQSINIGESNAKGIKTHDISDETHREILDKVFKLHDTLSYSELQTDLRGVMLDMGIDNFGINKSKDFISWYARHGYLDKAKNGKLSEYKKTWNDQRGMG